jgi:hypothetical protein
MSTDLQCWIQSLPLWSSDALRRLTFGNINDEDKKVIINNLKKDNNIETSIEVDAKDFPQENFKIELSDSTPKTILCAIGPSKHVNKLADDQIMKFAIDGITIIYGDNGSGKSGYCRITKKLCRTLVRDDLLGDVFKQGISPPAEVTIRYKVADAELIEEVWIDGNKPPEPISRLTVFDAKCARFYVDKENKIEYLPAEIELVQRYIDLLNELKELLKPEVDTLRQHVQVALPSGYAANGDIAKLISKLDARTPKNELPTDEDLKKLGIWAPEDDLKILELEKQLAENPALKLSAHKTLCASLVGLSEKITAIETLLSSAKIEELEKAFTEAATTAEAAKLAASTKFQHEKLDSTGSDPWRLMYKYATNYAKSIPTNAGKIPSEVDDLCLLCQQPLDAEASSRLKRFEQFVEDEASKAAQTAVQALKDKADTISKLNLPKKAEYEALLEQYAALNEGRKTVSSSIRTFMVEADTLLTVLKSCITDHKFTKPAVIISTIGKKLVDDIAALQVEIQNLEKDCADNKRFAKLQEQVTALKDRKRFAADIEIFTKRLSNISLLSNLNQCVNALDTTNASKKITQLRNALLTENLKRSLLDEIEGLDLNHLPFNVASRTNSGATLVAVNLKAISKVSNSDVLSEGEQRALALACFLAEIKREPIQHGIIVDDPVSSLDHLRIRKVANRLVREAKNRQVIIFTHNILFYNEIKKYAAEYRTPCLEHYIHKSDAKGFGIVNSSDKHWQATPATQRIELLKTRSKALVDKTFHDDDTRRSAVKDFYTDLRETWERLVEEFLLNNVVGRFDSDVRTQSLAGVIVEDSDYETVFWAMKRASENSGHDKASGTSLPLPTDQEILEDVKKIEDFRNMLKKRRAECEERRKALQNPPIAQVA